MVPISANFSPYRAGIGNHRPFPASSGSIVIRTTINLAGTNMFHDIQKLLMLPRAGLTFGEIPRSYVKD
jgi:hypothetical protein